MWVTNGWRCRSGTIPHSWRRSQNDRLDPPSSLGQNRLSPYQNLAWISLGCCAPRQSGWSRERISLHCLTAHHGVCILYHSPQKRVPILSTSRIYGLLKIDFAKQLCGQMLTCSLGDISSSGPARLKQVLFSSRASREWKHKGEIHFSSPSSGAPREPKRDWL